MIGGRGSPRAGWVWEERRIRRGENYTESGHSRGKVSHGVGSCRKQHMMQKKERKNTRNTGRRRVSCRFRNTHKVVWSLVNTKINSWTCTQGQGQHKPTTQTKRRWIDADSWDVDVRRQYGHGHGHGRTRTRRSAYGGGQAGGRAGGTAVAADCRHGWPLTRTRLHAVARLGWTSPHRCASGVTKLSATEHLARCVLLPTGSVRQMVMSWCLTCSFWSQPFWFHVTWLA